MGHAILSPSGSATWTLCPGQINQVRICGIENRSGAAAKLGTAAHELLEKCLINGQPPIIYKGETFNVEQGGFVADDDMVKGVTSAYDFIMKELENGGELFPERKVNPGLLIDRDDCDGTADVTIILSNIIKVYDYKNGYTHVEVKDNTQLLLYAIGALAEMTPEDRREIKFVEIGVLQPNGADQDNPNRTMVYSITDMYAWVTWFKERAAATDDPNASLTPGENQCRWCRAKPTCPALGKQAITSLAAEAFKDVPHRIYRDPKELTLEEVGVILDNADQIIAFVKAVMGHAQDELKAGRKVPGQKLVRGKRGNSVFNEDNEWMIQKLKNSFGLKKDQVTSKPTLLGVKRILKLAKEAPKFSDAKFKNLEALVQKPEGKLTIAPESDERPSAFLSADEAFKDVPKIVNMEKEK